MAISYKTKAFVFKKEDRGESDRVFSVFTEDFGRLDIYAKAIRKSASKLRGGMDIFFLSDIEFIQGKNRKTLIDAAAIKKFDKVSGDVKKMGAACKMTEIIDNFIKGQEKDSETFNLLLEMFGKLEGQNTALKSPQLAYQYFLWNFISLQGYKSEVNHCAACRTKLNPSSIYFSCKDGGIICQSCSGKREKLKKINADVVKTLRLILDKNWPMVSRLKIDALSQKLLYDASEDVRQAFCPTHC